jgi:Leucine-rich repeat (LRR) protein
LHLNIHHNKIKSFAGIGIMANLKNLRIHDNNIKSLAGVVGLVSLEYLQIINNIICKSWNKKYEFTR